MECGCFSLFSRNAKISRARPPAPSARVRRELGRVTDTLGLARVSVVPVLVHVPDPMSCWSQATGIWWGSTERGVAPDRERLRLRVRVRWGEQQFFRRTSRSGTRSRTRTRIPGRCREQPPATRRSGTSTVTRTGTMGRTAILRRTSRSGIQVSGTPCGPSPTRLCGRCPLSIVHYPLNFMIRSS